MKRCILFLLAALVITASAQAQISSTKTSDTVATATTTYLTYTSLNSGVKSFQVVVTKISGTLAGTCLLQGTLDGTNWTNVNTDTLTLANSTTNQKTWLLAGTYYKSYRVAVTNTGTNSFRFTFTYLRRPDEQY